MRLNVPSSNRATMSSDHLFLRPIDFFSYEVLTMPIISHMIYPASTRGNHMAYRIATSDTGIYVVLAQGMKIVKVVRKCDDRADAEKLLNDLRNWRL